MITNKDQKGQSLLEVLTALGVAAVVIVALSILAVSSLRNAQHARSQTEATKFVNEGIEQVRTVRDQKGWNAFGGYTINSCYVVDTTVSPWSLTNNGGVVVCGSGGEPIGSTQFKREIKLEDANLSGGTPGCSTGPCPGRKITVSVFWTDSFGLNTSQASTVLTEWK
jgi:type II secretory pathway pseudopilin PulG